MDTTTNSPASDVARIKLVEDDGCLLYLETPNGRVVTASAAQPTDYVVGDVVLVRENALEPAPDELWPEDRWVAVVRLKLDDLTVLDSSGHLRLVNTTETPYEVGNTVLASVDGVKRRLDSKPIRIVDIGESDETTLARYKSIPAAGGPTFDDFGGLSGVVARAQELIEVPLNHHDKLQAIKARPIKGVLFTGLPGTGKTMLARIIASRAEATFYEIRGPEFVSKWLGQSEQALRLIFEDAAQQQRSIIFFDEIDSVAGQRADDAHEASRRVVAQLLTLMDGFTPDQNVMVVATTNRPQDIDRALLRPGRFDWEIEFPLPDVTDRVQILEVSARHLATEGHLPHAAIAEQTEGWSAADLAVIWSEAALLAVVDGRSVIMAEDYRGGFNRVAEQKKLAAKRQPISGASS